MVRWIAPQPQSLLIVVCSLLGQSILNKQFAGHFRDIVSLNAPLVLFVIPQSARLLSSESENNNEKSHNKIDD